MQTGRTLSRDKVLRCCAGSALVVAAMLTAAKPAVADPMRVSEDEGRRAVLAKVAPAVPLIAKQAHLSGRVVIDMTVGEEGNVEKVDVISGNPILSIACVAAGKKWTFKPF